MDPPTPVTTPRGTPPPTAAVPGSNPGPLLRSRSAVSLRSLFTISVCSVPGDPPAFRCPHCREIVSVHDDARPAKRSAGRGIPLDDGECSPLDASRDYPPGASGVDSATLMLLETVKEADQDLRRICQDLHQIHLVNPSPAPSRASSFQSLLALSVEHGANAPAAAPPAHAGKNPSSLRHDHAPVELPHKPGFRSGHPLITDLGDLVNLSQANVRLLKTLQDKVNKVDLVEKLMRAEREELEREKELLTQMRDEIQVERLRLMDRGLEWGRYRVCSPEKGGPVLALSGQLIRRVYQVGGSTSQSAVNMSRGGSSGTAWEAPLGEDEGDAEIFDEEWTQEKEQQIRKLEERLRKAQRGWSEEQEDILESLDKLREEKRRETKAKRLERQIPNKPDRARSSDEKTLRKKSLDNPDGIPRPLIKNPFSSLVRKSSTGSMIQRRESSASTAAATPKLFKKWF